MLLVLVSSTPDRPDGLKQVFRSLSQQTFDRPFIVRVRYDGYDKLPDPEMNGAYLLHNHPNVILEEELTKKSSGTLARLHMFKPKKNPEITVVALMDDDIVYPNDYLEKGRAELVCSPANVGMVTHHGNALPQASHENRERYRYTGSIKPKIRLDVPGVGVSFSRPAFWGYCENQATSYHNISIFRNACDIFVGMCADEVCMKIMAIPHGEGYMSDFCDYEKANWKEHKVDQVAAFDYAISCGWLDRRK